MRWYLQVWKKYWVFSGRATRSEYWYFVLFNLIATMLCLAIDFAIMGKVPRDGMGVAGALYTLATILPGIAVAVRRLHDTGRRGWWMLLLLVPIAGPITLLVFLVMESQAGENRYGTSPLAAS